jgi:outer membrane PBP1 activator LpoA protein
MRRNEAEVYRSAPGKHGRWGLVLLAALLHACTSSGPTPPPKDGAPQAPGKDKLTPLLTRPQDGGQVEALLQQGERALSAGDLATASAAQAQITARLAQQPEASELSRDLALRWAHLRSALVFTAGDTLRSAALLLEAQSLAPVDQQQLLIDEAFDRLSASLPPPALPPQGMNALAPYHDLAQALAACASLPARLPQAIAAWEARWPGTALPSLLKNLPPAVEGGAPLRIAVLLPFTGPLQGAAEALRDGLLAAQFEAQRQGHGGSALRFFDTRAAGLSTAYGQALSFQPGQLLGPLERDAVSALDALRRDEPKAPPLLALNRPSLGSAPTLWSYALEPEVEGEQLADQNWRAGHRRLLILHDEALWAQRLALAASTHFEALGGIVARRQPFSPNEDLGATVAAALLVEEGEARSQALQRVLRVPLETEPRRRQDVDSVLLIAEPLQGQTLKSALAYYFAGDLPVWASSQGLASDLSATALKDLENVTFSLTPWQLGGPDPESERLRDAFPDADGPLGLLYALGVDAWRLAQWQRYAPPGLPFPGLTGQLAQGANQRWVRTLRLAIIERGALSPAPVRFALPAP